MLAKGRSVIKFHVSVRVPVHSSALHDVKTNQHCINNEGYSAEGNKSKKDIKKAHNPNGLRYAVKVFIKLIVVKHLYFLSMLAFVGRELLS